jgi:hypothetical protein
MHSMIVFRMDKSFVDQKGKKPLDIILDVIMEYVPLDIKRTEPEGTITFLGADWNLEVVESCPINDPDNSAITVTFNQIPADNLLMHRLMLMNKESRSDVIKQYKEKYPNQDF